MSCSLVARECPQGLRRPAAVLLQLRDDLEGDRIIGRLEDLHDVVLAERDVDADELAACALDRPLALFDAVTPGRGSRSTRRGPLQERDVVRHRPYLVSRASQRLSRPSRHRLPSRSRRPDQSGPRARQRRAGTAQHVRRVARPGRGRRRARFTSTPHLSLAAQARRRRDDRTRSAGTPNGRTVPDERASFDGTARRDTTGALLLTNDGPLAHQLAHPRTRSRGLRGGDRRRPARTSRSLRGVEPTTASRRGEGAPRSARSRLASTRAQPRVSGCSSVGPRAPPAPQCLRRIEPRRLRAGPVAQ